MKNSFKTFHYRLKYKAWPWEWLMDYEGSQYVGMFFEFSLALCGQPSHRELNRFELENVGKYFLSQKIQSLSN